jgi:hypothetical protein
MERFHSNAHGRAPYLLIGLGNPADDLAVGSLLAAAVARLVSPEDLGVITEVTDPLEILGDLEGRESLIVIDKIEVDGSREEVSVFDWTRQRSPDPTEDPTRVKPQTSTVGNGFWEFLRISSGLVPVPRVLLLGIPNPLPKWRDQTCSCVAQAFPYLLFQCLQILNRKFNIRIDGWAGGTPRVDSWELVIDPPRDVYPR